MDLFRMETGGISCLSIGRYYIGSHTQLGNSVQGGGRVQQWWQLDHSMGGSWQLEVMEEGPDHMARGAYTSGSSSSMSWASMPTLLSVFPSCRVMWTLYHPHSSWHHTFTHPRDQFQGPLLVTQYRQRKVCLKDTRPGLLGCPGLWASASKRRMSKLWVGAGI